MVEISVIIPAYNEERYIEKALDSLKKQSYKNFEIIVVDDGSTDRTREIVKKFKQVILINGKHAGPGASRNLGAENAKGEFLVFVDADMTFDKNYLKNLISPMKKSAQTIGTTHDYEIATNISNPWSDLWGEIRVSKESAKEVKIFRAIRKKNFLEMKGFDPRYGYADDQTFWFKHNIGPVVAADTTCYHRNPETLKETYKQARWIGRSWKNRFRFLSFEPIALICLTLFLFFFPFIVFAKSLEQKLKKKLYFRIIFLFYFYKFGGYLEGFFSSLILKEFKK